MKTLTLISTFLISLSAFANPKAGDFNRAIMEDVKDDLLVGQLLWTKFLKENA
jgi:hypothetical protein